MVGFHTNINSDTLSNDNFRKVIYTGAHCQLVLMSLLPNEKIDMEVHPDNDQFFRFESGEGTATLNGVIIPFKEDDVLIVPAGTQHEIANTSGTKSLKMYTIYSPAHHKDGTIHATKADAEAAE